MGGGFILSLFSAFFGIMSAYIAGLYYFLHKATLSLRVLAFFVLTISLIFLGFCAIAVGDVIEVINTAWDALGTPIADTQVVRGWLQKQGGVFQIYYIGMPLGFGSATLMYLVLAYMTFFYRWPESARESARGSERP